MRGKHLNASSTIKTEIYVTAATPTLEITRNAETTWLEVVPPGVTSFLPGFSFWELLALRLVWICGSALLRFSHQNGNRMRRIWLCLHVCQHHMIDALESPKEPATSCLNWVWLQNVFSSEKVTINSSKKGKWYRLPKHPLGGGFKDLSWYVYRCLN